MQVVKPPNSLPSTEVGVDLQDESRPVINRNSCPVSSSSSSSALLPSVSELKSGNGLDQPGGTLQTVNLKMMKPAQVSSSMRYNAAAAAAAAAVPGCNTPYSTSSRLVSADSRLLRTEAMCITAGHLQTASSVVLSALPTAPFASQNSLLFNPTQHASALVPPNGLVLSATAASPVVKTLATQTQRLIVPETVTALNRAVIIAPNVSVAANNIWSSGTPPVVVGGAQLVHLTIPPMVNLTGTNVQIQRYVSVPSQSVSSGRSILLGSKAVAHPSPTETLSLIHI